MWINLTSLNILNAIFSTCLVLITSLVGLYYFRKATRASLIEVVDDLGKIASVREEANEVLQSRITQLADEMGDLREQIAHLEGMNDYLLESKLAWRRHSEVLEVLLKEQGKQPPPRPPEA